MDLHTSIIVLLASTTVAGLAALGTRRRRGLSLSVPWFPWHGVLMVSLSLAFLTVLQIISIWKGGGAN